MIIREIETNKLYDTVYSNGEYFIMDGDISVMTLTPGEFRYFLYDKKKKFKIEKDDPVESKNLKIEFKKEKSKIKDRILTVAYYLFAICGLLIAISLIYLSFWLINEAFSKNILIGIGSIIFVTFAWSFFTCLILDDDGGNYES